MAACLLPGLLGAAITGEEFSVTRLDDNVFAIIRNDPAGFAMSPTPIGMLDRVVTLMTTITNRVDAAGGESLEAARKQIAWKFR